MKKENLLKVRLGIEWEKVRQLQLTVLEYQKAALVEASKAVMLVDCHMKLVNMRQQQQTALERQEAALIEAERFVVAENLWIHIGRMLERARQDQQRANVHQEEATNYGLYAVAYEITRCEITRYQRKAVECQKAVLESIDKFEKMILTGEQKEAAIHEDDDVRKLREERAKMQYQKDWGNIFKSRIQKDDAWQQYLYGHQHADEQQKQIVGNMDKLNLPVQPGSALDMMGRQMAAGAMDISMSQQRSAWEQYMYDKQQEANNAD